MKQLKGNPKSVVADYVSHRTPMLLRETEFSLGSINKVFASSWISDRQVVFGTKCNKLYSLDLHTKTMTKIPCIQSKKSRYPVDFPCGIHAVAVNPSKSLLATGTDHTNNLAVYILPSFDPACAGEGGHRDWIFDIKWLDDQILVTGSNDNMFLWRVEEAMNDCNSKYNIAVKRRSIKACSKTKGVRAFAYNGQRQELASLSLDSTVRFWDVQQFIRTLTIKLRYRENVCICEHPERSIYAVGSQSCVTLIDSRSRKTMTSILSKQIGCGIRSLNFNKDVLSIGTGHGAIYFFDIRAHKYLNLHCGHALTLNAGKGWLLRDETYHAFFRNQEFPNAIYSHSYDDSGTRLFAAGGPLPAAICGNYAGLWH